MLKKIALWVAFAGLSAVLVVGAIKRTSAKTEQVEAIGTGGRGQAGAARIDTEVEKTGGVQNGNGRNRGADRSAQAAEEPIRSALEGNQDWYEFEARADAVSDAELMLVQEDGSIVLIEGRAWRYALESGFSTQLGHTLMVTGFYEDGEFKPMTLDNLVNGESVVLRAESGRPMWSGGGRFGA